MEITISVAARGRVAGTTGWLAAIVREGRIVIVPTKDGTATGCWLHSSNKQERLALVGGEWYATATPARNLMHQDPWIFGVLPTEACREAWDSLCDRACELLQEYSDSQDQSLIFVALPLVKIADASFAADFAA